MRFVAKFNQTTEPLAVKFKSNSAQFDALIKSFQQVTVRPDAEYYEGEYSVTPKVTAQTLETENKLMSEDLTVKAIPYFEVSNLAGGSTVTIGNMND